MRLSGPNSGSPSNPAEWIANVKNAGYGGANLPLNHEVSDAVLATFLEAAKAADIVVAEVGAWSNPIDADPAKAKAALDKCKTQLAFAERSGARCCVNIVGSRNPEKWDGPHPENFSDETFEMVVQTTREIIDAVKPKRTFYCLETMPWIFPSSPDEYLALIKAVDRPAMGVHLDPVNMINTPARYYRNGDFIRDCFAKLGPYIKSCHAKDIILRENLTVHLDECRPGTGFLDFGAYLRELDKLDPDIPLYMEHLPMEEYPIAADYIRSVAKKNGLRFK
ncbi:Sugar phosphate isomerase/epimerase [Verrucomicrobium sp. GAS474]|uniref:sugar phosphate isomerase/epimerase family protein n=1 Tax=Verrucomicrobium sp. GAS474 TaxID=1882831 RepID=UPI0008796E8D|nr:TIM barrel protein [Verrucomicrobium sp. GAS474]SDT98870.1 Sugar phosphate isomerase/epimerase [Verrucomicrobium sp. GAS474]